MRVVFAGTPDFAVPPLLALLAEHDVVAVLTQPDRRAGRGKKLLAPPVKQVALEHNLPVFQPLTLNDQTELIEQFTADVMIVVAYGMLLPQSILDIPKFGCLNIHASILPRWRGAAPIQRAIEAGDKFTGVAIMQMEAGLDTGPVFKTLETPIEAHDTSASLHDRLSQLGADGIIAVLTQLQIDPSHSAQPQAEHEASYAHKISKSEALIDWSETATEIDNKVRAFVPWPICETRHRNARIRIHQAQARDWSGNQAPGTVIALEPDLIVACGKGALQLISLQRDGGKPMLSAEFCRGHEFKTGDQLGGEDNG